MSSAGAKGWNIVLRGINQRQGKTVFLGRGVNRAKRGMRAGGWERESRGMGEHLM